MTAPQPDTETLQDVETMRERALTWLRGRRMDEGRNEQIANDVLDLAARLAETEAQRDDGEWAALNLALEAAERRVATLEAALRNVTQAYPHPRHFQAARKLLDPAPSQSAQRLTYETESRDARGRRTIHPSLTAEDAAYVARRATWERE